MAHERTGTGPTLVLASGSPRRREILESLGIRFSVRPVDVDESLRQGEPAEDYVHRLAETKVGASQEEAGLILAADTAVVVDREILGKPRNAHHATAMLRRLSGRRHTVLTGVALSEPAFERRVSDVARSEVEMGSLSEEEIQWYVQTGEPMDKAGSYAIQGLGGLFVEEVVGNYSNVVGLPLPLVNRLFRRLGYDLRDFRA